jgi:hypothetical protein
MLLHLFGRQTKRDFLTLAASHICSLLVRWQCVLSGCTSRYIAVIMSEGTLKHGQPFNLLSGIEWIHAQVVPHIRGFLFG